MDSTTAVQLPQATRDDRPDPLLEVRGLSVKLPTGRKQTVHAVRSVDLTVYPGERVGLVGESGSGKSVTVKAISGLLPESPLVQVQGSIAYRGTELVGGTAAAWRDIRAKRVSMIFQDPSSFLNPTMKIGRQVQEALDRGRSQDRSRTELLRYIEMAGLSNPLEVVDRYPFELSGGMRQRALIAIALAKLPELVVADEPTTALDATVQRRVLKSLDESVDNLGTSLLLITHDLAVVAGMCNRVYVMYGGEIVESGTIEKIFYEPEHEYTKQLLQSVRSMGDDTPDLHVSTYGGVR